MACFLSACMHDPIKNPLDKEIIEKLNGLSQSGSYKSFIFPASDHYSALPNQDPRNPVTSQKVALGKLLFHETGLSQKTFLEESRETISCGTCHRANFGFTPGAPQGVADGAVGSAQNRELWDLFEGDEVDAQGVRPLSVLNVGYQTNTLWSGTFGASGINEGTEDLWDTPLAEVNHTGLQGIEAQNIEGLKTHRMEINEKVLDEYGYRVYFDYCFPSIPKSERYSLTTASFALSAYLRTLYANQAPFQQWLKGDENALSEQEKRGAVLFLGKANCTSCHSGPAFSSSEFHALGTQDLTAHDNALNTSLDDERHLGRAFFTQNPDDAYRFKVPQLYNLKDYTHFFHGSSKESIREVIEFKTNAHSENLRVDDSQISEKFRSVHLTTEEVDDLAAFLENALYDSNLERYVPKHVLSGNCIPNNDPVSRWQEGCD